MYDWNAPLPPCERCGVTPDEDDEWIDTATFWGHADCAP
jgi:hypothetical protein